MESPIYNLDQIPELYKQTNSWKTVQCQCGTKVVNLCIAKESGLPIPNGFVLTKNGFDTISKSGNSTTLPSAIWDKVVEQIRKIEEATKTKYSGENPLFLAVSGVNPTPGVICVGMNDYTTRMFEKKTQNRVFAYYCYSKFIRSYGVLVLNVPEHEFDNLLDSYAESRNLSTIEKFSALDWVQVTKLFKSVIVRYSGVPFPQDPLEQLKHVILGAVAHYSSETDSSYRSEVQEDSTIGHAVLVTEMCFGGIGSNSCVGAISSHEITTGAAKVSGIYGTNVVVEDATEESVSVHQIEDFSKKFPDAYKTLTNSFASITKKIKEPMTYKFVVEDGKLTVVSVRRSTFSGFGRFAATVALVNSKTVTSNEALTAIHPSDFRSILMHKLKNQPRSSFCTGFPCSYGAGTGIVSISTDDTFLKGKRGQKVIHVKRRFYNSDIKALIISNGLVTSNGGLYSKGAYYANALCKPAAIKCSSLNIDDTTLLLSSDNISASIGDEMTVFNGNAYISALPLVLPESIEDDAVKQVMKWVDEARFGKISVLTDVKSIDDVVLSATAGSDGIGMFKIENFITNDREAIAAFAETNDANIGVEIENRLSSAFSDLFAAAKLQMVTIQLITDPLENFLPSTRELTEQIARLRVQKQYSKDFSKEELLKSKEEMLAHVKKIHEKNPLLGLHGIRLGLVAPELFEIQIRSILRGAKASRRRGADPHIRIMLPMVTDAREIIKIDNILNDVMLECEETAEMGSMIECPRACYIADRIAEVSQLICFNINTLHESTFGICDKDAQNTFMTSYTDLRIFEENPFSTIDQKGVGKLMKLCIENAKKNKSDIVVCITGDNCYDVKSVSFCYNIGIDTITCEPMMTPVARLCAAQAVLEKESHA